MKITLKPIILIAFFFLISSKGFCQLSISYYDSSLSKVGLGYDFGKRFWSEFRLYGNTTISNVTPELVFCYNVAAREKHNVYLGAGINANYFTGFVLPAGVRFTPFDRFNRFSMHIEFQPTLDFAGEDVILQSAWGIRYKFGRQAESR